MLGHAARSNEIKAYCDARCDCGCGCTTSLLTEEMEMIDRKINRKISAKKKEGLFSFSMDDNSFNYFERYVVVLLQAKAFQLLWKA